MRYSIFAGLPLAIIAMTAFYELASRVTTYDAAVAGGLIVSMLVLILLHRWDGIRLNRLLHPPPHQFAVHIEAALAILLPTLEQIQFHEIDGTSYRWRLKLDPERPSVIGGKLRIKTPLSNPNIVAWMIDIVDKGRTAKLISMTVELEANNTGTRTTVRYEAPPLFDWSRLEEVIRENNRWIDAAMLRACTSSELLQ